MRSRSSLERAAKRGVDYKNAVLGTHESVRCYVSSLSDASDMLESGAPGVTCLM